MQATRDTWEVFMDLMRMIEGANGDIVVLSRSEGAWLGVLCGARFEPDTKGLAAIVFRRNGGRFLVPMEATEVVGQDAILVRSRADAHELAIGEEMPGRDLRTLREVPVTTHTGERLGYLSDVRVDRESGRFTAILLNEQRALELSPDQATFGPDEVLVPGECSSQVRRARVGEVGLLARMSTGSTLGDVVTGVRRIVTRTGRARSAGAAASSGT